MGIYTTTKKRIIRMLDALPPESLHEVQLFLDFLRFKNQEQPAEHTREPAAALGGLLQGYRFTEDEIAQARREMWGRMDERVR
ncbi:MAG TPA: hypothetical protein ENN99_08130 [Chloroflexi bacterium]|nr:hypothetical protein [Chloroflexota bacterium]